MPINSLIHLTNQAGECNVVRETFKYEANRAECWNTPHGSNPTLISPVNGLQSIIQLRLYIVVSVFCGPTDSFVGLGRFRFLGCGVV